MHAAEQHYRGDLGRQYHEGKRSIPERAFPWVARTRAAKFASHVPPDAVVFEYGVGYGWNLASLPCRRRLGYDLADFLAEEVGRRGIEFVRDPRLVADGSVDVALCHHTLEHLPAPAEALAEMRRMLRPRGHLVVMVPYERERRYRRYRPGEPNHHLFSWNVQSLAALVASCGFQVEEARLGRYGYDRIAAVLADRFRLGERGFRCIRFLRYLTAPLFEVRVVAARADAGT